MDPISEMLTTIRNCQAAHRSVADVPYSKVKESICKILSEKRIIESYQIDDKNDRKIIQVLLFPKTINHLRRISKPGRRVYVKAKNIKIPLSGLGYMIISTPKGLVESREAKKLGLGGEAICEVW